MPASHIHMRGYNSLVNVMYIMFLSLHVNCIPRAYKLQNERRTIQTRHVPRYSFHVRGMRFTTYVIISYSPIYIYVSRNYERATCTLPIIAQSRAPNKFVFKLSFYTFVCVAYKYLKRIKLSTRKKTLKYQKNLVNINAPAPG